MLVVLRRNGESIVIGEGKDQVTVRFLDPAEKDLGYQVRMSVTAPESIRVECAESWGRGATAETRRRGGGPGAIVEKLRVEAQAAEKGQKVAKSEQNLA